MSGDFTFFGVIATIGLWFALIFLVIPALFHHNDNTNYDIPMCDSAMYGSHWSIWTHDANQEGKQITQQYLERGWHNITVEIHNVGVNDRVLADC